MGDNENCPLHVQFGSHTKNGILKVSPLFLFLFFFFLAKIEKNELQERTKVQPTWARERNPSGIKR